MSKTTFKFYQCNGLGNDVEIQADSIKLVCSDGQEFELLPRKSDGEVTLYAKRRLGIAPRASNCVRLTDS